MSKALFCSFEQGGAEYNNLEGKAYFIPFFVKLSAEGHPNGFHWVN